MKIDQRINELFTKYLLGKCSPTEWEELLILIDGIEEGDTETLSPQLLHVWEQARQEKLPSTAYLVDKEKMLAAIIRDTDGQQKKTRAIRAVTSNSRFLWRRVAAAAVIGLLLFLGTLQLIRIHKRSDTAKDNQSMSPDRIMPGASRAILTLANGQQILLDSAGKGTISHQGAAAVMNEGNGKLSYRIDKHDLSADNNPFNTISTARGNQYQLVLADGSKVWLNASSSLRYPSAFLGSDRTVEMTGEAYFEIAKDISRPFHVHVNGTVIEVLGTKFNVNAYTDEAKLKTSLLEGAVKVIAAGKSKILQPGQESTLMPGGMLTVDPGDVDLASAWKNGYFQFDKASLQMVMRQIGRWYDLDIEYSGPVPDRLFKGKIQRNLSLSAILRLFQKSGVHFTIAGKVLKVSV